MAGPNREYRDRLFKFIFGNPGNREWTLSLYNAVNGTSYKSAEDISYTTVEDAVYMNMKNDVSFLVANTMSFYEQQSTYNPNMPMRFLIYSGMVYAKFIEQTDTYHQYSSQQQKAPTPKCICFYNGRTDKEDRITLSLRESFDAAADIEVKVTMLNINFGHNKKLLEACKPLEEYAWFVANVSERQKELNSLEAAIDSVIDEMPEGFVIKAFLAANRAEVKRMCITEYNEARTLAEEREEGEKRTLDLIARLIDMGRINDIPRVVSDFEFRNKLYKELGIQ